MRRLPTLIHLVAAISAAIAFLAAPATARAAWVGPVSGVVSTPYRNGTDPYGSGQHRGIDIAAPIGTPVVAAAAGDVRFAGTAGSSGLTISIRTGDGYDTSYLHLSSLAVHAGAHVAAGDRIGAVGITGTRSATAPHLHFGVRDAGTSHAYHDPLTLLPPPAAAPRPSPPASAPPPAPRPARPVAVPAPVRAPRAAPRPDGAFRPDRALRPDGAWRPEAAPHPLASPHRSLSPQSARGRQPMPRPAPSPLPALGKGPSSVTAPHPKPAPHRLPQSKHAPHARDEGEHRVPASISDLGPAAQTRSADARGPEASPLDVGWALVCGGLLLAAGILGMTPERGRGGMHTRTRSLTAALRPLTGRR